MVKISVRSDEIKERLFVAQLIILPEKLAFDKTQNKFEQWIFSLSKVESCFFNGSMQFFVAKLMAIFF